MNTKRKPYVSDLNDHMGYWMRAVSNSVSQAFAQKLETSGVTVAEWVVLRTMYGGDDMTSPSEVAELIGLTRGAVSKLINRLIQKGFITRKEAIGDRRFQDVRLTESAIRLVPKLAKIADENDETFFHVLSKPEQERLLKFLKKLVERNEITKVPTE